MDSIYLDWAATTPILDSALEVYNDISKNYFGNASSLHKFGKEAAGILKKSRVSIAEKLAISASDLYFTSGGSESNAIVLNSILYRKRPGTIILTGIEHPSIFEYANLFKKMEHTVKTVGSINGIIQPTDIEKKLDQETFLVSVMLVNNILGTIQPIKEIADILRGFEKKCNTKIHFHCDAVQGFCKIPFFPELDGVDSASFSAHKVQGPKGIGALYLRNDIPVLSKSGGQEKGIRPGTENIPAIASFAEAVSWHFNDFNNFQKEMREKMAYIFKKIRKLGSIYILTPEPTEMITSPSICNFAFPGLLSEVFTRIINDKGVMISSGSACSSKNKAKQERVLKQMGFTENICESSVRLSIGPSTTEDELKRAVAIIEKEIIVLKNISKLRLKKI